MQQSHPTDTRDRLIKAAIPLFARKGFEGTSIKELAQEAGVNVSLVSYHFGGKEGLYRACLEEFGRERLAVAERLLQAPQSLEEFTIRLKMFMEEVMSCHCDQSEITLIIHRELEMNTPAMKEVFAQTFLKSFTTLVRFFESAQKNTILDNSADPEVMAALMLGSIFNTGRMDCINREYFSNTIQDPKYRARILKQILQFCNGCLSQHPQGGST